MKQSQNEYVWLALSIVRSPMDGHEQYPVLLVPTWDPWNDFFPRFYI